MYVYLLHSPLMAAALKRRGEERIHDFLRRLVVYKPPRHHQHVGVVVLTDEVGYLWHPRKSCPHATVSVEGHAHALTASAYTYARVHLAAGYALSKRMS